MSDSYIVRIHRRVEKPGQHHDMVGVVEDPVAGRQQAFHDADELWAILEDTQQTLPDKSPTDSQSK